MTTFYLIRHAANDFLGNAIAGRQPGVHLNSAGHQQAEAVARWLARTRVDRLFSSPLERCRETAAPAAEQLGLDVEISDALTELDFGEWTNKRLAELESDPRWRLWNSFRSGARIPGGETMIEAQRRIVSGIHQLHSDLSGQTLALFSHGDPIRAALLYFLGMPLDLIHRIEAGPASISQLTLSHHGPQVLFINREP